MKTLKVKEIEMPLLTRKRISFELENQGQATPSRNTIKEEIAKKYKTKPELVSIKHIYTRFGLQKAKIIAHIYKDEKTLKYLETPKGKKEKKKKKAP